MKAVWYTRQGPPAEVMQFGEQPTPHAAAGEARVRLHASRFNPATQSLRDTVSAVYPLARIADAHAAVEYAPKRGTVVVNCTV